MRVVEQLLVAKTGNDSDCEDGIAVTDSYAAVVDGATDKTGFRVEGVPGGRWAMLTCVQAVAGLPERADVRAAVRYVSGYLAERLPAGVERHQRPEAAMTVVSRHRREVWQLGDVGYWHHGLRAGGVRVTKRVDRVAAEIRGALLAAELAAGADAGALAASDPGRAAIHELLVRQSVFRNNAAAGSWAYGAVDGTEVPADLVGVYRIPAGIGELALATDGYPSIGPTLGDSERQLSRLIEQDPLCIGVLSGTKAVLPGNLSYDDRAYLRLRL